MKLLQMSVLKTSFLALIGSSAMSFSTPSFADDLAAHDISGSWVFETGKYNQGACHITGIMTIAPSDVPRQYTCEFTTFEKCTGVTGLYGEIEQVCTLRVQGNQAAFVSQISNIAEQRPYAYDYAPDDWRLTIQSGDEMTGTLESASRAYVKFMRKAVPTS